MPTIFEYTDYRRFLADYYREQKLALPAFSYKYFANKIGFKDKGFVFNVIAGKKNLSNSSVLKITRAIRMDKPEADFFEYLVLFNQAKNLTDRNHYYNKLSSIKPHGRKESLYRQMLRDKYEFYSNWYVSVIRSLIEMYGFKGDFEWLAKSVYPSISIRQARKGVALLEKLGMIRKNNDGSFAVTEKIIKTSPEIEAIGLTNFQLQTTELAQQAIQHLPRSRRNITGLTMGISSVAYDTICKEIERFQSSLAQIIALDQQSDRVFQLNFHFFPVSDVDGSLRRNNKDQ
jgi:uncharacterized protein (TIGR02147 family)